MNKSRFEVKFKKGETIIKQGGPLTHIACLTSGLAKIYIEGSSGKNIILKILKPGELSGGPGLNVDFRHHFTISAIEESTACLIDIKVFGKMLDENISFASEFIKYLNEKTIKLFEKLANLTQKQMHGRIAETLLYLSQTVYNRPKFHTYLSRNDFAELSSLTKESTIRILKEFKDEGIINVQGNNIEILKEEVLQKISKSG
ncbi:MAG: Crp/Fnr family transcriptional regulator [Bacteroidales bacterium]|nr:Crp/Fnr family transcriptional regulator [Bacteroidales bacterium]